MTICIDDAAAAWLDWTEAAKRRLRTFPQSSNGGPDPKETLSQLD